MSKSSYAEAALAAAEANRRETERINAKIAEREAELRERAKEHFLPFVRLHNPRYKADWVHRDICRRLERFSNDVAAGKRPRLILNLPPQHGKSELISRRFPGWHIGRNAHHKLILASYSADLAVDMSIAARQTVENSVALWPHLAPNESKWRNEHWETIGTGGLRSAGVGGGITGMSAWIGIIDDPIKGSAEASSEAKKKEFRNWYQTDFTTRLQDGAGILIPMTRWTEDDPTAWLLELAKNDREADQWEVIRYPAIAEEDEYDEAGNLMRRIGEPLSPVRYKLEELLHKKANMSAYHWAALYQQRPSPAEGSIFKREWFNQRYAVLPTLDDIIISCDLTFKDAAGSDYVVLQVWGRKGPDAYLIDQVRARMDYPDTRQAIRDLRARHTKASAVVIEDKANGPAIIAELRKEIVGVVAWTPRSSKAERAQVLSVPRYAAGQIHLPQNCPWIGDFVEEHIGFGAGAAHDDQVDAESQAFGWWQEIRPAPEYVPTASYNARPLNRSRLDARD